MELSSAAAIVADAQGVFDADAMPPSAPIQEQDGVDTFEALRLAGNAAFQQKAFARACDLYTRAIALDPMNQVLFSNRSAARFQLGELDAAREDAERAIALAPQWIKGYQRKAIVCEALQQWNDALDACESMRQLSASDRSIDRKKLDAQMHRIRQHKQSPGQPGPAVRRGFFQRVHPNASASIYDDKEDITRHVVDTQTGATRYEHDDERRWRRMLRRLKESCKSCKVGSQTMLDDGIFAKLLREDAFRAMIYPGIPKDHAAHAPKSLQELLQDPWYEEELLTLMPRVEAKAESVLTNVKKRGAQQGEVMDAQTEELLRPQVLQEAFGREVMAMVQRVNNKKHAMLAADARLIADPTAEQADWDQLPPEFVDALMASAPASQASSRHAAPASAPAPGAVLDDFMGDEWSALLLSDVQRMAAKGLLTATPTTSVHRQQDAGSMRFLTRNECDAEFPALSELIQHLHALPYELNKKRPDHVKLCAEFAHCTCLHRLQAGERQPLQLDCGVGEKDNGFQFTCIYFLNTLASGQDAGVSLGLQCGTQRQDVSIQTDRLVMFRSQQVLHEITVLPAATQLFFVTFWIHGRSLAA